MSKTTTPPPYLHNADKSLVAMYLPDAIPSSAGPIAVQLLGFKRIHLCRHLHSGLIQARVESIDSKIIVAGFREFGPNESRPLATALLEQMSGK